jgi:CRISPR/Cas system CSM-associated protein Csm5 (group 7 of RAMP superfamily)
MSPLVLQTPLPPYSLVYWVRRIYKRERKVLEIFTSSSLLGQGAGIESTSIVLVTTKREREKRV